MALVCQTVAEASPWATLNNLGRLKFEASLASLTTFGTGGQAAILARLESVAEIAETLEICRRNNLPHFLLGGGSNVLFSDGNPGLGFNGVVIKLGAAFEKIEPLSSSVGLKVGAAATGSQVLKEATRLGLSGLEGLAGIPGTMGGAVVMNAGSFGLEIGPLVEKISWWSPQKGLMVSARNELEFSYRSLAIVGDEDGAIILELELKLTPENPEVIHARVRSNLEKRRDTQPKGVRCAGSIFKNPTGHFAGRLIEEAGFKGMRVGGAMVSEKHANFIVNAGQATSGDIIRLIEDITKAVAERQGVTLTPEIKIIDTGGEVRKI